VSPVLTTVTTSLVVVGRGASLKVAGGCYPAFPCVFPARYLTAVNVNFVNVHLVVVAHHVR